MTLSIQITGNTPEELATALRSLAAAFGGGPALAEKIVAASVSDDQTTANVTLETPQPAPGPEPDGKDAPEVKANVKQDLSPAEMRDKASETLMMLYNRDPNSLQAIKALQDKYKVKKFPDVPLDQAQAFYADAMLLANGTGEVAA